MESKLKLQIFALFVLLLINLLIVTDVTGNSATEGAKAHELFRHHDELKCEAGQVCGVYRKIEKCDGPERLIKELEYRFRLIFNHSNQIKREQFRGEFAEMVLDNLNKSYDVGDNYCKSQKCNFTEMGNNWTIPVCDPCEGPCPKEDYESVEGKSTQNMVTGILLILTIGVVLLNVDNP